MGNSSGSTLTKIVVGAALVGTGYLIASNKGYVSDVCGGLYGKAKSALSAPFQGFYDWATNKPKAPAA